MEIFTLRIFSDVARRGSFASVARERNMDPSSVSRLIAGLETELGLRLFQRTTRKLTLSEAGEVFLARIEAQVEEIERAQVEAQNISAEPSGILRITTSVTFGQMRFIPLIPAFRKRYPGLKLNCLLSDENIDLIAERIDLAIRLAPTVTGDVITTKLIDTHYRVVASPGYLKSCPVPLTEPRDITRHKCLLFPYRGFRARWLFKDMSGALEEVAVDGDITLSTAMALRDAAILGLGPAILPHWLVADAIAAQQLVDLCPRHAVTATSFDTAAWLVYPSRAYLPRKVRLMIDFLKENFG